MKTYIVTVPQLLNSMDFQKVQVEAEDREDAIQQVFNCLPPGKGIKMVGLRVEERLPNFIEVLGGLVISIEDIRRTLLGLEEGEEV